MHFSILFLLIGLYACGQQSGNKIHPLDPRAKQLNDSAMFVAMQTGSYGQAIELLDQATRIDSNYLTAYGNKLIFQLELKKFEEALITANNLIRINPDAPEHFANFGMIYECKGDTVLSKKFFTQAAKRYDIILDTMNPANKDYDLLLMNKAINLVLVGEQQKGNEILQELYIKQKDETNKQLITLFINKSKQEILNYLLQTN